MANNNFKIDKDTRRSTFLKNNNAALTHGGFSKNLPVDLRSALLDSDLGFELGMLKGQLSNIATLGAQAIKELIEAGDSLSAAKLSLSCSDSATRLVPQIHKLINATSELDVDEGKTKGRNKWLRKFRAGGCNALEVAYQFETNQLGEVPEYIRKTIDSELRVIEPESIPDLHTREELNQKVLQYRDNLKLEADSRSKRKAEVDLEKKRINTQFFGGENE